MEQSVLITRNRNERSAIGTERKNEQNAEYVIQRFIPAR